MDLLALIVFGILVILVLAQSALALTFLVALRRFRRPLLDDSKCPRATVVLCLRGPDPFLPRCLEAIFQQDYPNFDVRIVIDHEFDPARPIVDRILNQTEHRPRVIIQELEDRLSTCSLKCSSLVQAVNACDESVEVIAQLDADTIPHRSWLRELVTALADEKTGAATGNRWYMPEQPTIGSLVRYAWNAAAVVQMFCYRISWGGTLAIKTAAIRDAALLDRWSRAFCEDTMLFKALRDSGWKVAFVPSLMMINRETCDLPGFFRWVKRQLLTSRLYHPGWPAVVTHGLGTSLGLAASVILLGAAIVTGNYWAAGTIAAGLAIYQASMFLLLMPIEASIRQIARARGEPTNWLTPFAALKLFASVPVTQCVYPAALAGAAVMRDVDWRGVSYRVDGPWDIRLVEYRPFEAGADQAVSTTSL